MSFIEITGAVLLALILRPLVLAILWASIEKATGTYYRPGHTRCADILRRMKEFS